MCILSNPCSPGPPTAALTAARLLPPQLRQRLACQALAGQPVTDLAHRHQVSRKFVYQQRHHAQTALDQAITPPPEARAQLLFGLLVTKTWLRQLVPTANAALSDLLHFPYTLGPRGVGAESSALHPNGFIDTVSALFSKTRSSTSPSRWPSSPLHALRRNALLFSLPRVPTAARGGAASLSGGKHAAIGICQAT
jgi:hypothetical protein